LFYARQGGSDVARDAARSAAVGDERTCAAFRAKVQERVNEIAGAGAVETVTRTYAKVPAGRSGDLLPGDQVVVKVSFKTLNMHLPFVPVPDKGKVVSTVTSRLEYVPTQPETCS
jgi:hypothetical protein